jgi:methylthioribulose-1-phosphate dehydratase
MTTAAPDIVDERIRSGFERPTDRAEWPEIAALRQLGAEFHRQGWSLGTSSNYSVVLGRDPLRLLVTASGKDKSKLAVDDFVVVDSVGVPDGEREPKPSAETPLHCVLAATIPSVGAVLHTHSVWATILSDRFAHQGGFTITGYEMLKGLAGVGSHDCEERLAIFENTQDIPKLAAAVGKRLDARDPALRHGYLIRRHGLYTWGRDLDEARRQVEIFEFLFEALGRSLSMNNYAPSGLRPL